MQPAKMKKKPINHGQGRSHSRRRAHNPSALRLPPLNLSDSNQPSSSSRSTTANDPSLLGDLYADKVYLTKLLGNPGKCTIFCALIGCQLGVRLRCQLTK